MIIGVDINNARKEWGERFGMTHFVNPKEIGGELVPYLVNLTKDQLDKAPRYHQNDDWDWSRDNDQLVHDYYKARPYWGA